MVVEAAAAAGPGLFALVGVGRDQSLDVPVVDDLLDRVVLPVAGVTEHDAPACSPTPAASSSSQALSTIGSRFAVSSDSVLISAASTIWPSPTTSCAL